MGEAGLDEAQHAALMALTPKELPIQASLRLHSQGHAVCCDMGRLPAAGCEHADYMAFTAAHARHGRAELPIQSAS